MGSSASSVAVTVGDGGVSVGDAPWESSGLHIERSDGTQASFAVRNVNAIVVRADGAYVAGTREMGAIVADPGARPRRLTGGRDLPIFAVAWLASGEIALGGRGHLTIMTTTGERRAIAGLVGDEVTSLLETSDGLWLGTRRGVALYRNGSLEWRSAGLAGAGVQSLVLCGGALLAGSNGHGIFAWNPVAGDWRYVAATRRAKPICVTGHPRSSTLLVGSQLGGLYATDDAGASWRLVGLAGLHVTAGLIVLPERTHDATGLTLSDERGEHEMSVFAPNAGAPSDLWMFGTDDGQVAWSSDHGATWLTHQLARPRVQDLAWIDGQLMVAAGWAGLWLVDLARRAATQHPGVDLAAVSAIGRDCAGRLAWLGGGRRLDADIPPSRCGDPEYGLYRLMVDGSVTFAMACDGPVWSILEAEPSVVVVGTACGIRISDDAGQTWTTPASADGIIGAIAVQQRTGLLFASTEDVGVLISSDGGHTWHRSLERVVGTASLGLATQMGPSVVVAGGAGIFRRAPSTLGTPEPAAVRT